MKNTSLRIGSLSVPYTNVHTLIIGSGAAGLNAAVQLHAKGIDDILILTEGLEMGTSINTGSDKQTYYKLGIYGDEKDCPESLAKSFYDGGSMHGDIALVEAALSPRAFLNLVNLGVPFPSDIYGQYVGYKTDHDPLQRATSAGPYTSREMCRMLIKDVKRRDIEIRENRVAVKLLTTGQNNEKRACGTIALNTSKDELPAAAALECYCAENVVFAVGGPGGLYRTSVYPKVQTGAIGLALAEGAKARNLPESQFGMASTRFRWNVSGTYMQVVPRFISTKPDGKSEEKEFLRPWFNSAGDMNSAIFLKGYQWPFDPGKVVGGSSFIDILVYIETVEKGRRVFLDYRENGDDFNFCELCAEAREYLENSGALFGTPIDRLAKMNRPAIDLYADHGIDITSEPLEIAVCAQHNNGGLAGNIWWESENVRHLFPVGEVNGSHGVYRPGGSALNSGQVAGFRAAEFIANAYRDQSLDLSAAEKSAAGAVKDLLSAIDKTDSAPKHWREIRDDIQARMSRSAAHIRSTESVKSALEEARKLLKEIAEHGCAGKNTPADIAEILRNSQLCCAHIVYLEAVMASLESGTGSRGSALVLKKNGIRIHPGLDEKWHFAPEDKGFREKVLETCIDDNGKITSNWVPRRDIPVSDAWFENVWKTFRNGGFFRE